SGSDRIQRSIDKDLDLKEAILRIEHADKRQIDMAVSLITGFPEETKEDLRATVAFLADSLRFDHTEPQLHLLAPLAETPITTRYKDRLVFDDIYSDMSHQGWEQEQCDREMIRAHPEIFTNFYAVPTQWLSRAYLKELREFILRGMKKFRWLLLAVHQDSGDLVEVFDQWRSWYEKSLPKNTILDNSRVYYSGQQFKENFF